MKKNELEKLLDYFSTFSFKIVDYDKNTPIEGDDSIFTKIYKFQKPEDTIKFKCGTCWDISYAAFIELEKLNKDCFCIYMETNEDNEFPNNHMFTVFVENNEFYSFEPNIKDLLGIKGPYNSIVEICEFYSKYFMMKYKGFNEIEFFKVFNFPPIYSSVNEVMKYLKENNKRIYFYNENNLRKFNDLYNSIIRHISDVPNRIISENIKYTIGDIILESELPSPYFLKGDIKSKLQKTNIIEYHKDDIIKFSKGWKFENEIKSMKNDFTLTIMECDENIFDDYVGFKSNIQGTMCEVLNPTNNFDEYIWIKRNYLKEYNDSFMALLSHELGHVWASIFGFSDENFQKGRTNLNHENIPKKFNQFQMDVFKFLYDGNFENLQFDYNYILKNEEPYDNWELSTHSDEIIEILVEDYLNFHSELDPENYLIQVFNRIENHNDIYFKDFSILDIFKGTKKIKINDLNYIKNIIRRMFLIFSFGTKEQIEYFKNICFEEFGKSFKYEH